MRLQIAGRLGPGSPPGSGALAQNLGGLFPAAAATVLEIGLDGLTTTLLAGPLAQRPRFPGFRQRRGNCRVFCQAPEIRPESTRPRRLA